MVQRTLTLLLTLLFSSFLFFSPSFSPQFTRLYLFSANSLPLKALTFSFVPVVSMLLARHRRKRRLLMSTVTIDGPAASGKGAVASALARRLGHTHLDSGALFRAVAFLSEQFPQLSALAIASQLSFDGSAVNYQGRLVPDAALRSEAVAQVASRISKDSAVRSALKSLIRSEVSRRPCVVEGRDCGSVLVNEAKHKFFLTADVVERARRRQRQQATATEATFEAVLGDIVARDVADARHFVSVGEDVVSVDCTWLNVDDTVERLLRSIQPKHSVYS